MTPKECFKFGFLLRCAEEGLTPEQTEARIKQASQLLPGSKQANFAWNVASSLPGMALGGLALGALGSVGVGAGAGLAAAKMTEPESNVEEVKAQEQIAAYNLFADQIRQRNALRKVREQAMAGRKPSFQFS